MAEQPVFFNPYATALDGLKLDDPVAAFFDFCKERENIRLKRAKGRIFLWNWLIYLTQIVGFESGWNNNGRFQLVNIYKGCYRSHDLL